MNNYREYAQLLLSLFGWFLVGASFGLILGWLVFEYIGYGKFL